MEHKKKSKFKALREGNQQESTNKESKKSVEQCLEEIGLTREDLSFYVFQAARSLQRSPLPNQDGDLDMDTNIMYVIGAYSLSWMLEHEGDAKTALENGLSLMGMAAAEDEKECLE